MQESLNFFGIAGPMRAYGNPMQFGHIAYFMYKPSVDAPTIQLDLFFTQVDGSTFSSPLWLDPDVKRCHYQNSGFQYVWYPGRTVNRRVLAPVDHELYLTTAYGADFMVPQGIKTYRSVFMVADIIESDYFNFKGSYLAGMSRAFHTQCNAYDELCPSPYAAETLWSQMVTFVHHIAKRTGLQYTLACESIRYLFNRKAMPPHYAAIAIRAADVPAWLAELQRAPQTTTFVLRTRTDDGSVAHLQFSRVSPIRLTVWKLPPAFDLKTVVKAKDSTHVDAAVLVNGDKNDYLLHMCDACELCHPTPTTRTLFEGALVNENTKHCLDASYAKGVRIYACHGLVGSHRSMPIA